MNTYALRSALLAVAMLAADASLSAQGWGPGSGAGRGLAALNLTEAQQSQVKTIHERHQAALKAKLDVADAARKAMREAAANLATDASTLRALHEKVSAAQFDLMLERRAVRQEILPLLTAEQKARFEKGPMGFRGARGKGPRHGARPDCPLVQPS